MQQYNNLYIFTTIYTPSPIQQSIHLYNNLYIYTTIYIYIYTTIYTPIHQSIHIQQSIYTSIQQSIHIYNNLYIYTTIENQKRYQSRFLILMFTLGYPVYKYIFFIHQGSSSCKVWNNTSPPPRS